VFARGAMDEKGRFKGGASLAHTEAALGICLAMFMVMVAVFALRAYIENLDCLGRTGIRGLD
jgi:hypothetical protein